MVASAGAKATEAEGNDIVQKSGGRAKALREFLFGMFGYEQVQQALEIRASMESLFMLVTFGDIIGLPIMPPYYALRLLPHVAGQVHGWKRRLLRERQFGDDHEHHLHGV